MPPKSKFSKEQILEAAFDIAKEEGISGISIRKVAERLGSSIAPIYVNFKDIEELREAVTEKVYEISKGLIAKQDTGEPFLNVGVASVKFAREYSVIFRELVLQDKGYILEYEGKLDNIILQEMKKDTELKDFSMEELKSILLKMKTFHIGLTVMAANEAITLELTEEKVIELLVEAAIDVVNGAKLRREKLEKGGN